MSIAYLLDTDICVWVIRARQPTLSRVRSHAPGTLAVSSITVAELWYGALKGGSAANTAATETFLVELGTVLPFDSEAARIHADLRFAMRAQRISEHDLISASIAVANGLTLVTGNVREFSRVPGLSVEDWTKI